MEDETEHQNQSINDSLNDLHGTQSDPGAIQRRLAESNSVNYRPQTSGSADNFNAQSASDAALDRIMPPTRPLSPEPTLDPDAIHFAKGHPDTLMDHIKDWIEWRLNKI